MSTEFEVNRYWLERGRTYIGEERLALEYHRVQERFLIDVLQQGQIPTGRILELGCGFGRITKLLAENFPEAQITALDLSPDQLANAQRNCAGCSNVRFVQYDFYSGRPFPGDGYDLAIAIEVFLHHPRPVIRTLVERLAGAATHVVHLDWSEDWPWQLPEHVWIHDYENLHAEAGLKCATFPLPEKVDGKQQRLFVAGRQLPAALFELELRVRDAVEKAVASAAPSAHATPPPSLDWLSQLRRAQEEIVRLVPPGAAFILVNDDQWGNERGFGDRRAIPFLEKNGRYGGPPADDATALRELERLRKGGASHIVFGWPSFWWLDHYAGLREHLSALPCVLKNERLVAFQLNS